MRQHLSRAALAALALPFLAAAGPVPEARVAVGNGRCTAAALVPGLPDGVTLTRAEAMAAGPATAAEANPNNTPRMGAEVGAHCLLQGRFEDRAGVGGKHYAIGFELRVPDDWNGRLLYQGGGGLDGVVQPAVGGNVSNGSTAPVALARGFAVVSTDSGHEGQDAAFADDQVAKTNFAYAAIGKVTRLARLLVARLAGAPPSRTYFEGCSNGGREAMIAAQRHAELFDGVVAGDPAFHLSAATVLATFSQRSYARIAPAGDDGRPVLARSLSDADVALLSRAVLERCDALDGIKDGLIFDHAACRFDPAVLQCGPGRSAGCLPPAKVDAIRTAFAGPRTRDGMPIASSWIYDAGVVGPGWRQWQTGVIGRDGRADAMLPGLVVETLARYFSYPPAGPDAVRQADASGLLSSIAPTAAMTDATATQMGSFAAKGGKMLLVTGWSDPVFTPLDLIDWYGRLDRDTRAVGGGPASGFARLFLVPGMNHCGGGPALDDFDALSVLVDWVENGRAPDRFDATGKGFPGISRPICAFPKHAAYHGKGAPEAADSFDCE